MLRYFPEVHFYTHVTSFLRETLRTVSEIASAAIQRATVVSFQDEVSQTQFPTEKIEKKKKNPVKFPTTNEQRSRKTDRTRCDSRQGLPPFACSRVFVGDAALGQSSHGSNALGPSENLLAYIGQTTQR